MSKSDSSAERRVGLARALSKLGFCSRSHAFDRIRGGEVRLNGRVQLDPEFPVLLSRDRIEVAGIRVLSADKVYMMLNKPRGIVTTASDERDRKTIYHLLPPDLPWLSPVGRLDQASEGLLLLTNDTEWGAAISAPESHLPKTYHVQIAAKPDAQLLDALRAGIFDDGERLRAEDVQVLREGSRNTWLTIVLTEGKNRQIRRMLQACDVEVLRLVRVAIGPLQLGDLIKGASRPLTGPEKHMLDRALDRV